MLLRKDNLEFEIIKISMGVQNAFMNISSIEMHLSKYCFKITICKYFNSASFYNLILLRHEGKVVSFN